MPWCPRCDETFPQGPACPRCSARLVARERETFDDSLESVPGLKSVRVSRRYLKALERLSGPRASGSRALAFALVLLVFASGFLLGRVGSIGSSSPTVRSLPPAKPIPFDELNGQTVAYVTVSREPLVTIATHDLFSGVVEAEARFSPPVDRDERITTRVVAFGRSVAVIVSAAGKGYVAFAPRGQAPQGWIPGIEAAWLTERELLIRHADGSVASWTFGRDGVRSGAFEDADELLQTSAGAVVRRGTVLSSVAAPARALELPRGARVLAAAPDLSRALIAGRVPTLWDGEDRVAMRTGGGDVLGAAFDSASERAAIVLRGPDGSTLALVDPRGNAQLKPLSGNDGCIGAPVWDDGGDWVYVAGDDGVVQAVEAGGGRIGSVRTQLAGCGVAWVAGP